MMHCDSLYMLSDKVQEVYEFGIKHFAGLPVVTYDTSNFLQVRQFNLCSIHD